MSAKRLIAEKYKEIRPVLDEQSRRRWAATEALALGRGGISAVARATGLSRPTIRAGIHEIRQGRTPVTHSDGRLRLRRPGAGRKPRTYHEPSLLSDLKALVESTTRGDPESPLCWTSKSVRRLAAELHAHGHQASPHLVSELLAGAGYSLQGARKVREGAQHPDRNAQFEHLRARVRHFQRHVMPVISVDAKKKELEGDFKNAGREWHPEGHPPKVRVYVFVDKELDKALPYGVYDLGANEGWVSVGVTHDTPAFAVATIRTWWLEMGRARYPKAKELLVIADSGGSNSVRARLWKLELQHLANDTGLHLCVSHLPPGTSKWNRIEHRMFCHITRNWRGRPLESREVIVNLIGSTTTEKGLHIQAALDAADYPTGIKVTDDQMESLHLERDSFHGDWNCTIHPYSNAKKSHRK
jgi:hypothetical protein